MQFSTHLQAMKAPPGRHSDELTPGLYLYVSSDGKNRRWIFRFTKPSTGKVTELGLGPLSTISLANARLLAANHRTALRMTGTDPVEAKRAVKAERTKAQRTTFGVLAEEWLAEKAVGWSSSQVWHMRHVLTVHAGALASKPIDSITGDNIVEALRPLLSRYPKLARRALAAVSRVFEYAQSRELCVRNPAIWRGGMQTRWPKNKQSAQNHKALSYAQISDFVQKLRIEQSKNEAMSPWAIEFVLLTAARTQEVTNMRWSEIDIDARVWTIPAERTKTGKEHRVPLSDRAMQLLAAQQVTSDFVWPGRSGKAPLHHRTMFMFLTEGMGLKGEATVHGFRSTFRDWAGDATHFARAHIEECLAHQVGVTERAYRRRDALEKRREIMQAWANYCEG